MTTQDKGDGGLSPQAVYTFNNSNPITINDFAAASPYPSNIHVTQVPDTIFRVAVSINLIQHTNPDDLDVLLVGPQGQKVLLMSDAGGATDITSTTLTFDDTAISFVPDSDPPTSGFIYRPTNYGAGDVFPAPAPGSPYSSTLSVFNGTDANGFWNLYVFDDMAFGNVGVIQGGWTLAIETLTVTNTNNSGFGSLRQAILNANSNPDLSTIPIRIPGTGPFEIALSSPLPAITSPVILDGTTQSGYAGVPLVQLNGVSAGGNGLTISSGGSTIKGLGIVAFSGNGILLDPGGGNTIQGCYIGLNIGGQIAQPNLEHGIYVGPGSANNVIGGTTAAVRNVISGNGQYGIVLGSSGQIVQGNYIGTNAAGTAAVGNADYGIGIFGTSMTIGGTAAGARNVISGNGNRGILITGFASDITVQGNYIGTSASGTADLGNLEDGILINGTSFNTIGGTTAEARNVISGNNKYGIQLLGAASGNLISGNFIGTNKDGNVDLGNTLDGVLINGASNNTIGGTTAGAGNVISGNDQNGIQITGAGSGNLIYGNYIGTESVGLVAVGNSGDGVEINSTSNATVGGTAAGAGNVISGNGGNGIYITNASGNTIQGNYVGVSSGGGSGVGNVMTGIFMEVSNNNLIGGTTAGARNVISGNGQYGMVLGSSGQIVQGNYIGTDAFGNGDLGNARDGIALFGFGAQIGGPAAGERNVISGNNENGIQLAGGASNNVIEGNYIGVGANGTTPIGNTLNGVLMSGTSNNTIGGTAAGDGNIIMFSGGTGVFVAGGTNNPILGNSIFGNNGLGIDLSPNGVTLNDAGDPDGGSNNLQNFPVLLSAIPGGGGTMITGVLNSTPNTSFRIEFFSNTTFDSSLYGEGHILIGSAMVMTNGSGDADINYLSAASVPTGQYIAATATRNSAPFDTSEFSYCLRVTAAASDVSNNFDTGPGSLRQAILDGNAMARPTTTKTITFNLIETTITLTSPLPPIAAPMIIDGTTQPGYSGAPIVELNGVNLGGNISGFVMAGGGSTIKGLVINRFTGDGNSNGILIQSNGNTVQGCYLGTNRQGTVALGNSVAVKILDASNNIIGGTTSAARNLISGNGYGVGLQRFLIGTTNNQVQGNYIGTDVTGTLDIGNTFSGVYLDAADGNLIGGTEAGARNIISGNNDFGVFLGIATNDNLVQGNFIGTDVTGTAALGNSQQGVYILGTLGNTIGGTAPGARNIISGNNSGVVINASINNQVQGNYIGTDVTGTAALGNATDGVRLIGAAENNTIGGTTSSTGNILSANGNGVLISGNLANNNQVQGNYIGTDVTGTIDLGNSGYGISIDNAPNNSIGGSAAGARNIISGNGLDGVRIDGFSSATGNIVRGNYIGTNVDGTMALGNVNSGVNILADQNGIGGAAPGEGNLISGNGGNGIRLEGFNNIVLGNYIGTKADGISALGNGNAGVEIYGFFNLIGYTSAGARNVISANLYGLAIRSGSNNSVLGNFIGIDVTGTVDLGNSGAGVIVNSGANTIGSAAAGARNIISGNGLDGVSISVNDGQDNLVQGNYIGTDVTGAVDLGNGGNGVKIFGDNNIVGGTTGGDGNVISGNAQNGIRIVATTPSNGNTVQGNYIGTTASGTSALGNSLMGIWIDSTASSNVIGGTISGAANTIAFNGSAGVGIFVFPPDFARFNAIQSNSIYSNSGLGIDLVVNGITLNDPCDGDTGANNLQNFPVITSALTSGGATTVQGTLNSTANTSFTIQFFSNATADPSGYGEGQSFIGSTMVTTNASCNASFSFNPPSAVSAGNFITATATDPNNNTSEFSQAVQVTPPTAIEFVGATARGFDDGVLIEWQTGMEVDNLGFNLYREESGKQSRINPQILAGSALTIGQGVVIRSGFSYAWWDDKPATQETRYWIEDLDLNGLSVLHGPIYAKPTDGKPPAHSPAVSLSQVGRTPDAALTHPVEEFAQLARVSQAGASEVSLQQANLTTSRAVKIGVKRAGWYRLTQAELLNAGLDPNTDPHSLRLFVDGIELPISVTGEADGSFDAKDTVEFFGLGFNTPSTDTRIYWLVSGGQQGLRINKTPFSGGDRAGESFASTVERRDRSVYFAALRNGDEENFFGAIVTNGSVEQRLTLNNLALSSTENAVIEVSLQGVTNLAHTVWISLNGSPIGELDFNGQERGQKKIEVPRSQLREGENIITLQAGNGPSDISLVDFIRVTYQRTYRAENDSLSFKAKGGQTTTIGGFSSDDIRVLDVTDERDVSELSPLIEKTKDGYAATVTATEVTATGLSERKLLALADNKALGASSVYANRPSHLLDAKNAADFLIISQASLLDALKPLAELRSKQGLATSIVEIEDIYDEFSFGHKSPQSIRDFLLFAATRWQLRPRFVLLAGDASYDPRNYLGLGEGDLVPTKLIDTVYLETASDDWFADFNGDGVAELSIGRLPVRTAQEAAVVVSKLIAYEHAAPSNEVALVADRNDGFDFEQASQSLRPFIPTGVNVGEIFRSRTDDATARNLLIDGINRGQKVVNYNGHGSANVWRGGLLTAADSPLLTNGNRLSLFVTMTCLTAYFQDATKETIGESLLRAENGGAIAVWGSSALCLPEEQAAMNRELYRLLFSKNNEVTTLGEIVRLTKASVHDADIRRTWILLGDPTIRLK